jgi:hypothetical protein
MTGSTTDYIKYSESIRRRTINYISVVPDALIVLLEIIHAETREK